MNLCGDACMSICCVSVPRIGSEIGAGLILNASTIMPRNATFATLLTRVAYLPGTLVLEWTLRMVGSQYPLVVMVNPSLPKDARDVLATRKIKVVEVDDLLPEEGAHSLGGHDIRFKDTWTKLRCALFLLTQTSTTME